MQPAIDLARDGFPVHPVAAYHWKEGIASLINPANKHGSDMLLNGEAPRAGDVMKMPHLTATFEVRIYNVRRFWLCVVKLLVVTVFRVS